MIRHIFSDMDGTLLNSAGYLSQNNIEEIKTSGIPFTLVSARAPMEMVETIDKLQLTNPQIAFNGGVIFQKLQQGIKVLHADPLEVGSMKKILQMVKINFPNTSVSCYSLNNWYAEKIDYGVQIESKETGIVPKIVNYSDLLTSARNFYKIMFISLDETKLARLVRRINELGLDDISAKQSGKIYLEITSRRAQKSKGIKYIQRLEKLAVEEMAAFGDGHNDLPMLQSVGTPIVMENALKEIKMYGKFITKTNDADGVSFGIRKYLNLQRELDAKPEEKLQL